jgi:hypothetical protein
MIIDLITVLAIGSDCRVSPCRSLTPSPLRAAQGSGQFGFLATATLLRSAFRSRRDVLERFDRDWIDKHVLDTTVSAQFSQETINAAFRHSG